MTVVVFSGPTIGARDVVRELDAVVRPPAGRGDVLRAALEGARAIVLIDGYFDRIPSVWHKEIAWAMSQGVHVFGASSMGALRAVECAPLGMVGIGEIVEAFQTGELEDDDEVAIVHGDAESGYRPGSEAMVNIRWTLRAAVAAGVIRDSTRLLLEASGKAMPYDLRELRALLSGDRGAVAPHEIAALRDWVPRGRVDRKRLDAVACLRHVADAVRAGLGPKTVAFRFAETDGWAVLKADVEAAMAERNASASDLAIEDELRARGQLGRTVVAAMMRHLAAKRFRDARADLNTRAVQGWIDEFRRQRELWSEASFDAWLEQAALDDSAAGPFFRRQAIVSATHAELRRSIGECLRDELRAAGRLQAVTVAARAKQELFASDDARAPTLAGSGLTERDLWEWFFRDHLGVDIPPSLGAYAAAELSTVEELRTSALRAYVAARSANTDATRDPRPWPSSAT